MHNPKSKNNNTIDKSAGKQSHKIFEQCVNDELKEMIVEETNQYAAEKNTNPAFFVADKKMILDFLLCMNL